MTIVLLMTPLRAWTAEKVDFKADFPAASITEKNFANLQEKKPKFYLLDFWASWCEPCKESLPFYIAELKKEANKDWALIAVNMDSEKKEAEEFLKKVKVDTWIPWDKDKTLAKKLNVVSIPVLFFVSADGQILKVEKGFKADSRQKFVQTMKELATKYLSSSEIPKR